MEQLAKQIYSQILEAMQLDPEERERKEAKNRRRLLARLRREHSDGNYTNACYATQQLNAANSRNNPTDPGQHREAAGRYLEAANRHREVVEAIDSGEPIEKIHEMSKVAKKTSLDAFNGVSADVHNDAGEHGGELSAYNAYKSHYRGHLTMTTIKPGFDRVHAALLPEHRPVLNEYRE
jgi:hypothetical protein